MTRFKTQNKYDDLLQIDLLKKKTNIKMNN